MSILGTRVLRKEDPKFLTTGGVYAADLRDPMLEGAGWVTFVRSTVAHARIVSIDTDDAKQAPGVLGVVTAADLGLTPAPYGLPLLNQAMLRTSLATDKVRFVGEPIVAIVTEHPYQGEDAAERVLIDYEVLPAVIDVFESRDGSTLLFEDVGTNVVIDGAIMGEQPPTADFFDGLRGRRHPAHREPARRAVPARGARRGAAAWVDGRLVQWSSTQHAQGARDAIASRERPRGRPRCASSLPTSAAASAPRSAPTPRSCCSARSAKDVGRPVRWLETRTESMQMLGHGRGPAPGRRRSAAPATARSRRTGSRSSRTRAASPRSARSSPRFMTKPMALGRLRHPQDRVHDDVGRHQHHADRRLPGRGPAGGHRRHRAGHGPVRRRDRDGSGRRAAQEPHPQVRRAVHDGRPAQTYDVGDYEGALDKVLAAADYDDAARRAERRAALRATRSSSASA